MNADNVQLSIIIPCFNERDHIEGCIRSILAQECPSGSFEIIVVDGRSTDGTTNILRRLAKDIDQISIIENHEGITPCAINIGIREACGKYIAILGAHTVYAPDYLKVCLAGCGKTLVTPANAGVQKIRPQYFRLSADWSG